VHKPELIVLVRRKAQEAVLLGCKDGLQAGSDTSDCYINPAYCDEFVIS